MSQAHYANREHYVFTSESVSEGHPDKVCDQVSDAILDAFIAAEPECRGAIETFATTNRVVVGGERRGAESVTADDMEAIARDTIKKIGYEQEGFHWEKLSFENHVHAQSSHIAQGVDSGSDKEEGAGDQGIMFGFATNETPELMPAPIQYSHRILQKLADWRHSGKAPFLEPDAKSQVSLRYEKGVPVGTSSIVVSTQHQEAVSQEEIRETVRQAVQEIMPEGWMCPENEFYVNPTGLFVIGGPDGDAGLTGRKIIVDTYGGAAPHGGGAFSGKDPTKVDRSAAYAARYLAKNVVGAGIADHCTIQLSYAIGVAKPISFFISTGGTSKVDVEKLEEVLPQLMDLSPRGIREHLQLNRPIYSQTAAYGHFGREAGEDGSFSWEKLDLVEELQRFFNVSASDTKVA